MPVNVSGIKEMKKALSLVDKDLLKEVQGEIRATMIPIRDKARSYAPADTEVLSGWTKSAGLIGPSRYRTFPKYNQQQVIEGIKYSAGANKRNSKGWSANNYVSNISAPGAIYETAGRKNPNGAQWIGLKADINNKEISHSLNPQAGAQFIAAMPGLVNARPQGMVGNNKGYKQKGRLIFRAWAKTQGKANAAVFKSIENTTTKFNRRTAMVDVRRAA